MCVCICVYIYIYMCVCVCVCIFDEREIVLWTNRLSRMEACCLSLQLRVDGVLTANQKLGMTDMCQASGLVFCMCCIT